MLISWVRGDEGTTILTLKSSSSCPASGMSGEDVMIARSEGTVGNIITVPREISCVLT
jgi:hypothetical protein